MGIVVQKFGGTSVADAAKIRRAAERVIAAVKEGHQVVVVASARGKQTDQLIADALELNPNPPKREMDQLMSTGEQQSVSLFAMALDAMGQDAISFTGGQIRMMTTSDFTKAQIKSIDADRIHKQLGKSQHHTLRIGIEIREEYRQVVSLGKGTVLEPALPHELQYLFIASYLTAQRFQVPAIVHRCAHYRYQRPVIERFGEVV